MKKIVILLSVLLVFIISLQGMSTYASQESVLSEETSKDSKIAATPTPVPINTPTPLIVTMSLTLRGNDDVGGTGDGIVSVSPITLDMKKDFYAGYGDRTYSLRFLAGTQVSFTYSVTGRAGFQGWNDYDSRENPIIIVVKGGENLVADFYAPDPTPTPSRCEVMGNVKPDLSSQSPVVSSGFMVKVGSSYQTTTDDTGYFLINGIVCGVYDIEISKPAYLRRILKGCSLRSDVSFGVMTMWAGDVNQDGSINMSDIIKISSAFNKSQGDPAFVGDCDLDKNGAINLSDIMITAKHFNKTSGDYEAI